MTISYLFAKLMKKIQIPAIKNSDIHKKAKVCSGSHIVNSSLNEYSYIGNYCTVICAKIGKFCSVADNCIIGGARHPYTWVSTSPVFIEGKNCMNICLGDHKFESTKETYIGNDVWIGNNCLIKGGVTIADGAVIGMGSVVTKDVGAYEIWGGNPARLIRKRFPDDICEELMQIKWWDHIEKCKKLVQYVPGPKVFIEEWKKDEDSSLG